MLKIIGAVFVAVILLFLVGLGVLICMPLIIECIKDTLEEIEELKKWKKRR